jgi:hypothetical protein
MTIAWNLAIFGEHIRIDNIHILCRVENRLYLLYLTIYKRVSFTNVEFDIKQTKASLKDWQDIRKRLLDLPFCREIAISLLLTSEKNFITGSL